MATQAVSYGFLTGWSKSQYSLAIYYKPFETSLWMWFFLFVILLAVLKTIFVDKLTTIGETVTSIVSNVLFVLAPILEDCVEIPRKINEKSGLKLVLGLWLVEACILTNLYNSSLISDLLSPMPRESIKTFEDLFLKCEKNKRFSLFDDERKQNFTFNEVIKESLKMEQSNDTFGFETLADNLNGFNFILNYEYVSPQLYEFWKVKYPRGFQQMFSFISKSNLKKIIPSSLSGLVNVNATIPRKLAIQLAFVLIAKTNGNKMNAKNSVFPLNFPNFHPQYHEYPIILHYVPFINDSQLFMRMVSKRENIPFNTPHKAQKHLLDKHHNKVAEQHYIREDFLVYRNQFYDSFIEEDLLKQREFVFIDTLERINNEYKYLSLSYQKNIIFKGDFGSLIKDNKGWAFKNTRNTNLPRILELFYESGCYNYFTKNRNYGKRTPYTRIIKDIMNITNTPEPLGLTITFNTFLYIWLITVAIAMFCVIFEIIRENGYAFIMLCFLFLKLYWFKVVSCCINLFKYLSVKY